MIRLEALEKTYRNGAISTPVLPGLDLEVGEGEFVALMGSSGTGKSTLLNILGCLDVPTGGRYYLDGVEVGGMDDAERSRVRNEKLGFVFQQFHLLPRADALANVLLPLVYSRQYPKDARERARGLLGLVGLHDRMHHTPGQLSGGQQQRVAIARALVNQPRLLLADEPTGNLDRASTAEIMELFRKLHRAGNTIIMVTHDEAVAESASRVLRMSDGRIVADEVRRR
jgi:putative ABC transport system ATP-binding protein